ncbi:hypothetical protein GCM10027046_16010 [Uliginosibacterium flavum]|uniref:GGDEF domain-containing protein n=1 Tax=Uliginosibacterium flavum TaxID=1396831 RepID=A0ABV2TNX4_9RHOO
MPSAFRISSLPLLACALVLALTAFAWQRQHALSGQVLRAGFDTQSEQATAQLQWRLQASAQLLSSIQGLYASSTEVSRAELASFFAQQQAHASFAGLRKVSLALLVLPEQREAFVDSQRQAGITDFAISPGGTRALYAPISQIVSTDSAAQTDLGRDPLADPEQQQVLTLARDRGEAVLSGKLRLSAANGSAEGFIIASPIFARGKAHGSIDERRSNILGWAIASFSTDGWMQNAFGEKGPALDLTLFDGKEDTDSSRLYQSDTQTGRTAPAQALFSTEQALTLGAQTWTLRLSSPADYATRHSKDNSAFIALLGGALALAVLFLCQYLSTSQKLASAAAEKAAEALHEAEERWRFALEGAGDGVWDWNVQSSTIHFSPRCDVILGVPSKGASSAIIHPEDEAPEKAAMQACLEGKSSQYVSEHRMQGEDGQWRWIAARGMVLARNKNGEASRMIGTVTDITERKTAADRLNNMAQHDAITGLPNRTLFFDLLQQGLHLAKRHKEALALMYVDLDYFKSVNDNFGKDVANKLLREVADTLGATVRDSDTVAHFGGDDFVVLLPTLASEADAGLVAEKIRAALDREFSIYGRQISITASIGVALFPQHARSAEALINSAARAVLQSRKSGRNSVCFSLTSDSTGA